MMMRRKKEKEKKEKEEERMLLEYKIHFLILRMVRENGELTNVKISNT